MSIRPRDPLLFAARSLTLVGMALTALVTLVTGIAAPIVFVLRHNIPKSLPPDPGNLFEPGVALAIALMLLLLAGMAACAFLFQRKLLHIVDSVNEGDPFQPRNAGRLAAMAWLTLAAEAIAALIGGIGQWLAPELRYATADFGLSVGGVLLALVLFVLARVFREGARMRDDLEGTV